MSRYPFTFNQEIGHQGQSLVPHYPGGKSGVTIGPGYDMGHRSPQEIYYDLTNAGIDPETAYSLIDAAHKTGPEAGSWISQRGGIIITEEQQKALFENVLVPEYEERTREQLENFINQSEGISREDVNWDNLTDKQKEILFDYVYNTGSLSRFPEMTSAVLHKDWDTVSLHYERFSDDQPLQYRNEMFFREFLDPDYVRDMDDWNLPENAITSSDHQIDENIIDLYQEDENFSESKDSDDWYDDHIV